MFTGIVEEKGNIKRVVSGSVSGSMEVKASKVLEGTRLGDSIAVNGVCLTVTHMTGGSFTADVMPETLRRTNLGRLGIGSEVNLERAMAADGRFGGHIVSGHIDGTGRVESLLREGNAVWVTISAAQEILAYIVEKGSICIDGISLTVAYVDDAVFKVSIIPHTGAETTLLSRKAGDIVNLENDIVGKYVGKLMGCGIAGANCGTTASAQGVTGAAHGIAGANCGTAALAQGATASNHGTAGANRGTTASNHGTAGANRGTTASNRGTALEGNRENANKPGGRITLEYLMENGF